MQKNGAGLHTATSCFWDNTTDGACTHDDVWPRSLSADDAGASCTHMVLRTRSCRHAGLSHAMHAHLLRLPVLAGSATLRWENKSMYCIVTVFALSL